MDGGLIFLNVIKLLKNLKIKAKLSTDTGFLKMMQAILILQGAKIRVINQQEKLEYDFVRNKADDVPEHLEVIQVNISYFIYYISFHLRMHFLI